MIPALVTAAVAVLCAVAHRLHREASALQHLYRELERLVGPRLAAVLAEHYTPESAARLVNLLRAARGERELRFRIDLPAARVVRR